MSPVGQYAVTGVYPDGMTACYTLHARDPLAYARYRVAGFLAYKSVTLVPLDGDGSPCGDAWTVTA